MNINSLIKILPQEKTLITMGGRSQFYVLNDGRALTIHLPKSGEDYEIKEDLVLAVAERYQSLPEKERAMTTQYGSPGWKNCPDMIVAPYVARIIQYVDGLEESP
jgi:hypothetical protein